MSGRALLRATMLCLDAQSFNPAAAAEMPNTEQFIDLLCDDSNHAAPAAAPAAAPVAAQLPTFLSNGRAMMLHAQGAASNVSHSIDLAEVGASSGDTK